MRPSCYATAMRGAQGLVVLLSLACSPATSSHDGGAPPGALDAGPLSQADADAGDRGPDGGLCGVGGPVLDARLLAQSPRANHRAEWLALEAPLRWTLLPGPRLVSEGPVMASEDAVARVASELASIEALAPDVVGVGPYPTYTFDSVVLNFGSAAAAEAAIDGGAPTLACLNRNYGAIGMTRSNTLLVVHFRGLRDTAQLTDAYGRVEGATTASIDAQGADGPDVCLVEQPEADRYLFRLAGGDCPAGCQTYGYRAFAVARDGGVSWLGIVDGGPPVDALPPWLEAFRPRCWMRIRPFIE